MIDSKRRIIERFSRWFFIGFLLGILFVLPYSSSAETQKQKKERKVIRLKEVIIKQRVIKPQAMFILTKSQQSLVKSDITTSQNFSSDIIKTMDEKFLMK